MAKTPKHSIKATEKPVIGEILDCPDCGLNLIVKSLNNGIQLEIVSEEEEDWGE